MPLKIYDALDAVPEDERDEYVEHDGKWHPKAVVELAAEKQKRATLLAEKKTEKEKREAAERERDALKQTREAAEKGVSEAELQKIRDAEAAARRPIEEERDRLAAENRQLKLTDRVQALYLKHGGMSDRVEDAMLLLDRRTDLGDAGGIVFKDKAGQVTADDAPKFFKSFATEKPWLFQGTGSSGSGAGGSNASDDEGSAVSAKAVAAKQDQVRGAF